MSVSNGEKANANVFNSSFVSREVDDNKIGKLDLENADSPSVADVQKELNGQASFTGDTTNGAADRTPTWNSDNIGVANQPIKGRVDSIQERVETNSDNIAANLSDIQDVRSTTGTADGDTNMGAYTPGANGFAITDNESTKENIQGLIDGVDSRIELSEKGVANGVATLDSGAKIPAAQLPTSVTEYKGSWDADTNTPTLIDGTGTNGDLYRVSVAGSQDLGSGSETYGVGDAIIYNGSVWQKIPADQPDVVTSVNGEIGDVVLDTDDVSEGAGNLYFTDARADARADIRIAASSVGDLADVDLTTPPANGEVLVFDDVSGNFIPGEGGSGSGVGGVTFVFEDFEDQESLDALVPYADAAGQEPEDGDGGAPTITVTGETVSPLVGLQSAVINKPASNTQGQGVAILSKTIDEAYLGQQQNVDFFWRAGAGYVADTFRLYVYYLDTAIVEPVFFPDKFGNFTNRLPSEDESFAVSGIFTPQGASYRIIIHCSGVSTTAMTPLVDQVKAGPALGPVQSSIITEWESFTPTVTGLGSGSGTSSASFRRVGDSVEVQGTFIKDGTNGTGSATVVFGLPQGLTVDSNKRIQNGNVSNDGVANSNGLAGAFNSFKTNIVRFENTGIVICEEGGDAEYEGSQYRANSRVTYTYRLPIQGWSSGTLVGTNELRQVVSKAKMTKTSTQNIADNFTEVVTFQDALFDQGGLVDLANDQFLIKKTGTYLLNANIEYSGSGVAGDRIFLQIQKNGAGTILDNKGTYNAQGNAGVNGSTIVQLNSGDTVRLLARQQSGVTQTVAANNSEERTYFAIAEVADLSVFTQFQKENAPTVSRLTSGSGTYITPAGAKYLRVRMVGGGGGGAGSGTAGPTTGSAGGFSQFGTSQAFGGGGGTILVGATGGGSSLGSEAIAVDSLQGQQGGSGQLSASPSSQEQPSGGQGGDSFLGGGGAGGTSGGGGYGAVSNSGGGGGGAGADNTSLTRTGGGGGAGGYIEFIIENPDESYSYSVGAGGAGGPAGPGSVRNGGPGAAGRILVEAYIPELTSPTGGALNNEIQTKILSSNVTSDGTISDLTFNNLTPGKWYEVGGSINLQVNSGAQDFEARVQHIHDGNQIADTAVQNINANVGSDVFRIPIASYKFQATNTQLSFVGVSLSANSLIVGNGSRVFTYVQLTELNNIQATNKF